MITNKYKCSNPIWKKFSPKAKEIFNYVYSSAIRNQEVVTHPKTITLSKEEWITIVYNMSCFAAWACDRVEVEIKEQELA